MNKILPIGAVLAVLQIAQSEVLTLAVLCVGMFALIKWLLKEAAERE